MRCMVVLTVIRVIYSAEYLAEPAPVIGRLTKR